MGTEGKVVTLASGKRGLLYSHKAGVFNAEGRCPYCCTCHKWRFTDMGFIEGGQGGSYRAYDDPADVPASPWNLSGDCLSVRLDWEDDWNCRQHNPYTQDASAAFTFFLLRQTVLTLNWSGRGERQKLRAEEMFIYVDNALIGTAYSPGGGLGCAGGMGPALREPQPPQEVSLSPGWHAVEIDATTGSSMTHYWPAWFLVSMSFAPAS